jgi:hypothetical protein
MALVISVFNMQTILKFFAKYFSKKPKYFFYSYSYSLEDSNGKGATWIKATKLPSDKQASNAIIKEIKRAHGDVMFSLVIEYVVEKTEEDYNKWYHVNNFFNK